MVDNFKGSTVKMCLDQKKDINNHIRDIFPKMLFKIVSEVSELPIEFLKGPVGKNRKLKSLWHKIIVAILLDLDLNVTEISIITNKRKHSVKTIIYDNSSYRLGGGLGFKKMKKLVWDRLMETIIK